MKNLNQCIKDILLNGFEAKEDELLLRRNINGKLETVSVKEWNEKLKKGELDFKGLTLVEIDQEIIKYQ